MKLIDITGLRYGRLIVTSMAPSSKDAMWNCLCDCGNLAVVRGTHLRTGETKSCGCARLDKASELAGEKFHRLTVIRRAGNKGSGANAKSMWECQCECGNITTVPAHSLKSGNTKSCGCLKIESSIENGKSRRTHGMKQTQAWVCWMSINQRCHNKNRKDFSSYGGRGINICERWSKFENFIEDMGHPPDGMSIDRKDTNGNYEPGNCRWATSTEQGRNKRNNRNISIEGITATLSEWSEIYGISGTTVSDRIKRGWSESDAIKTPTRKR